MYKETLLKLETEDAETIALWKVTHPEKDNQKHIFLTHGTFSDKRICLGISTYLVDLGYTCWIMEWRNHGASEPTKKKFNFETIALFDFKAAFKYLFEKEKIANLSCITHSGGGICLTMFLTRNQDYISKVNNVTIFACQAFGAALTKRKYLSKIMLKCFTKLTGSMPGRKLGNPHDEAYYTMKQWLDWNLKQNFKGKGDFDYLKNMPVVNVPIFSVCGKGDTSVAPIEGCKAFLDGFKNPTNKLLLCGKDNGFSEDYDHGRIILSKPASLEIWPKVLDWIENNDF